MFAHALREVRYHPGRLVATLLAIALSVGFMSAVSIFMATQNAAMGRMMALPTSKADVVVEANATDATSATFRATLAGVPGVQAVEHSVQTGVAVAKGDAAAFTTVYVLPSERFRWASLAQGAWPVGAGQIALSEQLADQIGARLGDTVDAGTLRLTVSGITRDAPTVFMQTAYVDAAALTGLGAVADDAGGAWLVDLASTTAPKDAVAALSAAVAPLAGERSSDPDAPAPLVVSTAADAQHNATLALTNEFDVMKNLLLAFSAVAALVGMIIIANTFTILLAQRRRQIGLLRAVGASGGQVRRRFLAEALVLGLIGSLAGIVLGAIVAGVGAVLTKAAWFGLAWPWPDLAVEVGVGVLLTVLAAMLPALRSTRVAPLEALQPVASSEQVRRASWVRAAVTGVLIVAGAGFAVASQTLTVDADPNVLVGPLLYAVVGAVLLTVGVLGAAPLYIPLLLKGLGRITGRFGATSRLAAQNAVRNPSRAAATATALMLATGLIVTLQIGVATAERTVLAEVEQRLPIDVTVATTTFGSGEGASAQARATGLSASTLEGLAALPNVRSRVVLDGVIAQSESEPVVVLAADPALRDVSSAISTSVPDGVLLTSSVLRSQTSATLTGSGKPVTLRVQRADWMPAGQVLVSRTTLAALTADPQPQAVWMNLADAGQIGTTVKRLDALTRSSVEGGAPQLMTGGSAVESAMIQEVLDMLLLVTTALLGVAVAIALIGVGNTLGLSVIERARESALLRALGMQRASLRLMLLNESLLLAGAGIVVGVAAGVFFGWLGMSALIRQSGMGTPLHLGVDWPQTLGMIAVAVAAAALASVLPGRRAANATPTEALAAD